MESSTAILLSAISALGLGSLGTETGDPTAWPQGGDGLVGIMQTGTDLSIDLTQSGDGNSATLRQLSPAQSAVIAIAQTREGDGGANDIVIEQIHVAPYLGSLTGSGVEGRNVSAGAAQAGAGNAAEIAQGVNARMLGGSATVSQAGVGNEAQAAQSVKRREGRGSGDLNVATILQFGQANRAAIGQDVGGAFGAGHNNAAVAQAGQRNFAAVSQNAEGGVASIVQSGFWNGRGWGHQAWAVQEGTRNGMSEILQAGENNLAYVGQQDDRTSLVAQAGDFGAVFVTQMGEYGGGAGLSEVIQAGGEGHFASVSQFHTAADEGQPGLLVSRIVQSGPFAGSALVTQTGNDLQSSIVQAGRASKASVVQAGAGHRSAIFQNGSFNVASVMQASEGGFSRSAQSGSRLFGQIRQ